VVVIDNFAIGRPGNLAPHAQSPHFKLVQADITDLAAIRPLFDGVDWVFHLAALADIVPSIEQPIPYHRANVDGTVNVLEAARHANVKRFVYAASSSCYGIPDVYPTPESAETRPMYPYALSKYLGEQCVMHWCKVYKLPAVSLRLFNVFGPRHRTTGTYGAVFGVFLAQKLAGKPFTVVGDGEQTRDFTYVGDIVAANVLGLTSSVTGAVNIGTGRETSIGDVVHGLSGLAGYAGEPEREPLPPGEVARSALDNSLAADRLGWHPSVSLDDGLARTLESFRTQVR
jgi:UDP-glucose 4-epimerase